MHRAIEGCRRMYFGMSVSAAYHGSTTGMVNLPRPADPILTVPAHAGQPTLLPPLTRRKLRCTSLAAAGQRRRGLHGALDHRGWFQTRSRFDRLIRFSLRALCLRALRRALPPRLLHRTTLLLANGGEQIRQNSRGSRGRFKSRGDRRSGVALLLCQLRITAEPTKSPFCLSSRL